VIVGSSIANHFRVLLFTVVVKRLSTLLVVSLVCISCGEQADEPVELNDQPSVVESGADTSNGGSSPGSGTVTSSSQAPSMNVENASQAGTACSKDGEASVDQSTQSNVACRMTTDGLMWVDSEQRSAKFIAADSVEACKTADLRDGGERMTAGNMTIGFPLSAAGATSASTGEAKLIAVAVEFPDYSGTDEELEFVRSEIGKFNEWLDHASRGRLMPNWTYLDEWILLDLPAAEYEVQGFGTDGYQKISEEIVDKVAERMVLENVDELFVYFPDSITRSELETGTDPFDGVLAQIGTPKREIEPAEFGGFEGSRIRHLKGMGTTSWTNDVSLWKHWAHAYMHSIGIALHSPESLGQIGNTGWDRWVAGWIDDRNVGCVTNLKDQIEFDLVPLEHDGVTDGTNLAVIKTGEYSAVVIESRRLGESIEFEGISEASGVVVYFMDTENVSVYDPFSNDESIGPAFVFSQAVEEGERAANYGAIAQQSERQPLAFSGESLTYEDLTIDFVATGYLDTIRVTKS